MINPPDIFVRIYERHGHRCPMSTLGGRLGMAAKQRFGAGTSGLKAAYSSRTCALDGIAEATGCSEEAGSLTVTSDGRHTLRLETDAAAVEVELTEQALEMAGRYRSLCNRLEKGWDGLAEAEQTRRRAEMDAMLDELLPKLWQMDDYLLVKLL